jgi:16S rRNA (uracil1498-N3)-methyltransferase
MCKIQQMHIPRIYTTQALTEHTTIELDTAAAHHIATVMRMKAGRSLILFNDQTYQEKQGEFQAIISAANRKQVTVTIQNFIERKTESPLNVILGVCLIKSERMDWLLQKATELGVSSISPLISEYTDMKISSGRIEKKYLHWQQVVINACEQSQRTSIPLVHPPQKIHQWIETVSADKKMVLHPHLSAFSLKKESCSSAALLVGPEGGLTEEEVDMAITKSFTGLTLGPRILRAETAPLAALTLLQHYYGDS